MVVNPYKYLFYRVYEWKKKSEADGLALGSAFFMTVAVLGINIFIVASIASELITSKSVFHLLSVSSPKVAGVASFVFWTFFLYLAWLRNSRYKVFCAHYAEMDNQYRRLRTVLLVVFLAVSWLSVIVVPIWFRETR